MNFDQFKNEWLGKRVDYDHVYGYQCVDLILQYIYECFAIPKGVWGNAVDYWNAPQGALLAKFNKIGGSEAQKGDIVVFNSTHSPEGHIGIATGNLTPTEVEILEQNGGGGSDGLAKPDGQHWDEIGTRYLQRSHVLGLLRPIAGSAPAAPVETPQQKYQVVETYPTGKQIKLNKQPTNLWGMNFDFNFMKDHPVEVHNAGETWTVTNKVHHIDGYDYYRREGQVDGFNVLDCDDYTPPPPPVQLPAAPLPIPTSTSPYTVVKTLLGFDTSNNAANHTNAKSSVPDGVYYVFNRRYDSNDPNKLIALNVTKTPGKPGAWINPNDNVEDPPPPPVEVVNPLIAEKERMVANRSPDGAPSVIPAPVSEPEITPVPVTVNHNPNAWKKPIPLNEEREPELFISMNTTEIKIRDLDNKLSPLTLEPLSPLHIQDTFVKDGIHYARTVKMAYEGLYFALPITILETAQYKGVRPTDYIHLWTEKVNKLIHDVFRK